MNLNISQSSKCFFLQYTGIRLWKFSGIPIFSGERKQQDCREEEKTGFIVLSREGRLDHRVLRRIIKAPWCCLWYYCLWYYDCGCGVIVMNGVVIYLWGGINNQKYLLFSFF